MIVKKTTVLAAAFSLLLIPLLSCGGRDSAGGGELIRKFSVDSSDRVITKKGVSTDSKVSRDGEGSIRIDVTGTRTIQLYQIGGIDIDAAFLIYRAAIRTEDLDGETFLEMLCYFQDKGEFFSRNYDDPLSGTNDWTYKSTPFTLRAGEMPDLIKLNLHVSGTGTVWIDDISLLKRPAE
mgnify:CR=1 FL=1